MQAIAQHAGGRGWLRKAKGGPVARTARQTAAGPAENACRPRGGRHRGPALSCHGSLPSCALPSPATNMHNSG